MRVTKALLRHVESEALIAINAIITKKSRMFNREAVSKEKSRELLLAVAALPHERKPLDTHCYNTVAQYLVTNKRVQLAEELFNTMAEAGVPDNARTRTLKMQLHARHGAASAKAYLREIEASRVHPNAPIYLPLLRVSSAQGATTLLKEMHAKKLQPSLAHFTHALQGVSVTETAPILAQMKEAHLSPDLRIYNEMITCTGKDVAAAEAVLQLLREKGFTPSNETYGRLANVYKGSGDFEGTRAVIAKKLAEGFAPSAYDFAMLIKACANSTMSSDEKLASAEKVYSEATLHGITSEILSARLMEVYRLCSARTQADDFVTELKANGIGLHPALRSEYQALKAEAK